VSEGWWRVTGYYKYRERSYLLQETADSIEEQAFPPLPGCVCFFGWQRLSVGSGAKGERFYDWAAARLPAVWEFDGDEPTRQR
jgi:hypothetical protein